MNEMVKMVMVLTVLSAVSGGVLAGLHRSTASRIEAQQLMFVKGPAIKAILAGADNDPISDRFKLSDAGTETNFFVGKRNGKADSIAFESFGKGFGCDIGLMVGVNLASGRVIGAAVTTHSETPGFGARAKDDPAFSAQFKGISMMDKQIKVNKDGGQMNALSGATITSRGVCAAVTKAMSTFQKLAPQIKEQIKRFNK
ncbi:MAG: RnfABCDGE type electron transport complex subunit G [Desulfobacteraceae bacterium]|nr:RnfABCDGE type electron transport complex subunit G [Desulfobacteraceae bacterium]